MRLLNLLLPLLSLPMASHAAFQSFEGDGFGDWIVTGDAFGLSPVHGKLDGMKKPFTLYSNEAFALSNHGGVESVGSLTSQEFTVETSDILFLIAGGNQPGKTAVQLIVDDKVVAESIGKNSQQFSRASWNVNKYRGKKAKIRLLDDSTAEWGYIAADEITFTNRPGLALPVATKNGQPFTQGLITTENLPGARIPEDSSLTVQATFAEHQLTSPTALTFDDQGRIYISETHRFRFGVEDNRGNLFWYLDDLASKKTEDRRALHEKWDAKVSVESLTKNSELIRRLADTDNDGKVDESIVFADDFDDLLDGTASGVFYFEDALYFACIPKIYKLQDEDGDGVAEKREVIQDGFGVRVSISGHDLNGFTLGPDGRIHGTVGDRGMSFLTKEGRDYQYPNEGAFFSFEPDGSDFRLIHTGLRNPKEIAFDELGNAFTVDNNSDQGDGSRIVYLVEGGDSGWQMEHQTMHTFHRQIGLTERPSSRWMNERMWEPENDQQPAYMIPPTENLTAGPSGLTYYPGAGFLESEQGRFLICDYKGGASSSGIWSFAMEKDGAGMKMADAHHFLWGIAATDVEYSFDGRLFLTDFVTGWKSHSDGRLISLEAGENEYLPERADEAAKLIREGFAKLPSAELAKHLSHPDSRIRLRAQIALTRRADCLPIFEKALASADQLEQIHAIWGLGIVARRGALPSPNGEFSNLNQDLTSAAVKLLMSTLNSTDSEIRKQAIRCIGASESDPSALPFEKLINDADPHVQFEAAIAIGRLKATKFLPQILDLLAKNNDEDTYLRHAGSYALQHLAGESVSLTELKDHSSPSVRLGSVIALRRLKSSKITAFLNDADPQVQDEVIRAITDLDLIEARPAATELLDNLEKRSWKPFILRRLIHNAYRVGGLENAQRLARIVNTKQLPDETRREAIRLLSEWAQPFPADQLTGHWRPLEERPLESLIPALTEIAPKLITKDNFVLTGALNLIEQYDIEVPTLTSKALRGIITNEGFPSEARAKALTLYIGLDEPSLNSFLAEVSSSPADDLALTALSALAERDPKSAIGPLEAAIDSDNVSRAQKSLIILAEIPGAEAADFLTNQLQKLIDSNGISATAIELIEASKSRSEASVREALAAYETKMSASSDPNLSFNVALKGGNVANGASLFASHPAGQCMRCHKADDNAHSSGGDAGPNLTGIATRHDANYLLESIIDPGAVVTPGYGITSISFHNGATLTGNLLDETPEYIDVVTPENSFRANRADIKAFTPPVSAMPPMGYLLKPAEVRDLVAWLGSLDKAAEKTKTPAPEILDPSTLPDAK